MKYSSNGMSSGLHSSSSGWPKSNPADDNNWRAIPSSQDRYDRTYNERSSGGYPSTSGGSGGGGGSGLYNSGSRTGQDRYGGPVSSRY